MVERRKTTLMRQFPSIRNVIYMDTARVGPTSRAVSEVIFEEYQKILTEGNWDVDPYSSLPDVRDTLGSYLGVTGDEIALMRCVSEGISTVAYGLDLKEGDEVVVSEEEHPSGMLVWLNMVETLGIKIKRVSVSADPYLVMSSLEDALNERTRIVSMSHVTTDTGTILPAKDIVRLSHNRGVPVLFDGAQSVGQIPVNLRDIGCDFYAFTGHKWLMGSLGTGGLFVSRESLEPLKVSWTGSRAGEWNRYTDRADFHRTAQRFEFGGRHVPLFLGLSESVRCGMETGIDGIRSEVSLKTDQVRQVISSVPNANLLSPSVSVSASGIVAFSTANQNGEDLVESMKRDFNIYAKQTFSFDGVRLSIAFFNDDAQIAVLGNAITELAS